MSEARPQTREHELRLLMAFAVQPFVAALAAFAISPLVLSTLGTVSGGTPANWLDSAASLAAGAGLVGMPVTVFAALPLFLWMRRRGLVNRRVVLWSGALLGNVPSALIVLGLALSLATLDPQRLTFGVTGAVRAFFIGSSIGVACAAVFWWLAGRHLDHAA
jgi:hypothetical protein